MNTIIWHNPRCSKSRATLALLSEKNISVEERRYLEDIPSKDDLEMVIDYLKITAWDLLRRNEAVFAESGLTKESEPAEIIESMIEHPILIERPIVIHNGRAIIGRPPENVRSLFE
tara:strand:+ start:340 stop:687 length:348 start_codon:yes stop_codon:yes gene_type:complete